MVDRLDSRPHGAVKYWPIVVLRVYTGLFFAWSGLGKISRDNFADGMEGFLNAQLANSFAFYRHSSNRWYCRTKRCSQPWLPGASWPWGWR